MFAVHSPSLLFIYYDIRYDDLSDVSPFLCPIHSIGGYPICFPERCQSLFPRSLPAGKRKDQSGGRHLKGIDNLLSSVRVSLVLDDDPASQLILLDRKSTRLNSSHGYLSY